VRAGAGTRSARAVAEYRIDELARLAGTTVRNVRAYQDRGLLEPPRRQGRVGLYSDDHLARLRAIADLLARGYTLSSIGDLMAAWQRGSNVGELLGLEEVVTAPWMDEPASTLSREDLHELFGTAIDDADLGLAVELGLLAEQNGCYRVRSVRLLEIGAELVRVGIPLRAVFVHEHRLRRRMEEVASSFVELVATQILDPAGDDLAGVTPADLAAVIQRLRPIAAQAVDVELAWAMERRIEEELQVRLGRLVGAAPPKPAAS
jgi:DNA-binding transcriptional MerR regulator